MDIRKIKPNPNNPRVIKDDNFEKLVNSLKNFPQMMEKRPLVCVTDIADEKIFPLGGNMRFRAIQKLGLKEIPDNWITMADDWTEEQRREFIIKDNVSFGDWDWEELGNSWDAEQLEEWGLNIPHFEVDREEEAPTGHGLFPLSIILTKSDYAKWQSLKKGYGIKGDTEAFLKLFNETTVTI